MTEPGEPQRQAATLGADDVVEPVFRIRADAVDWREVEGQVVALDRAGSVYLAINGTGAVLWPAIVEGATRSQLVAVLLHNFDVDAARAGIDVDAFVAELSRRHLFEGSG